MLAVHLGSGRLISRAWADRPVWGVLTVRRLLNFEAGYYLMLGPYALATALPVRRLPLFVFGALHVGAWLATRLRPQLLQSPPGAAEQRRELYKFVAFDLVETIFLAHAGRRLVDRLRRAAGTALPAT